MSDFWCILCRKLDTHIQFNTTCHPQTDKQTKVVNKSLRSLGRSLVKKNIQDWDIVL